MFSPLSSLFQIRQAKTKRISSYDKTGGNADCISISPKETKSIFEIEGSGIIRHIWITLDSDDNMILRNAVIRMFWDGEENPSVESPLGDFFGQGWGEHYNFISLPLAAAPSGGRALNCYFPMPFSRHAKITIENQSEKPIKSFYFNIDYEEYNSIPENYGRFHAWWNREITKPGDIGENEWQTLAPYQVNPSDKDNYLFAEIEGQGQFVGINYFVHSPTPMWYGEGDDMWLIDGEEWPGSLHGTGTEDFFNGAWCPNEIYQHPYFGYAKVPNQFGWLGKTHCYRFFVEDPIVFNKSLRASIEHGHANCLTLDICSVAYWYQIEPHKKFPSLLPIELRQNMPDITVSDIHIWRDAWRKLKGYNKLWGNEK
ncbi:glycoside hydrolase family 172 protein [Caldicellulosiruptoraceae bacterium PP1]